MAPQIPGRVKIDVSQFVLDPYIEIVHGKTTFQTSKSPMSGANGRDVFYTHHNDFEFRHAGVGHQYIKVTVYEDDIGYICENRIDVTKYILMPGQNFHETMNFKDRDGWSAGLLRYELSYAEAERKFHMVVHSIIGLSGGHLNDLNAKPQSRWLQHFALLLVACYFGFSVFFYMCDAFPQPPPAVRSSIPQHPA